MDDPGDEALSAWARALGLEIAHLSGCAGVVLPGRALLIDHERIALSDRRQRIAELLRLTGSIAGR